MPVFGQTLTNNQGIDNYPDVFICLVVDGG